jgi:predicted dehydrogenase
VPAPELQISPPGSFLILKKRPCLPPDAGSVSLRLMLSTTLDRRAFLHATLVAATAPAFAAQSPARRLKIGFLGVAHSHAAGKLRVARQSPDWELIGIAEEDAKLAEAHRQQGIPVLSPEQLIERAEVVAVESAVRDHHRHAKLALVAGKHVHVEKPPSRTLAEFRELTELAQRNRCLMQMGYMWRHHPGFAKITEAVRAGWLGEVSFVRATMNSTYDTTAKRAELQEYPGGGMFELGCHVIDQLVQLLGAPRSVTPTLRTHGATDALVDNAVAVFEFPRALAVVHINLLQPGAGPQRAFEVIGGNGSARMQPIEPPTLTFDLAKPAGPYKKGAQTVALAKYERYAPELADLADAVRSRRALAVTPETDLLVQEWLLRACGVG